MTRFPFVESDIGSVEIEPVPDLGLFVHADIHAKWSKDTYKLALCIWAEALKKLHDTHGVPAVYALVPVEDQKLAKFAENFGFLPKYQVETLFGQKAIVYECDTTIASERN